jgi:opacity protein-like surface antigen
MINKTNTSLGLALATLTMAGALVSPQAVAASKAERMAEAANAKAEILEAQLKAMQDELASLRAQVSSPAPAADTQKVQELDQWMASVKSAPPPKQGHDDMIFFRGGYARNDSQFAGNALGGGLAQQDAWYIGAGLDFGMTDDVWGLMDDTEVAAEVMFDWRDFGQKNFKGAAPGAAAGTQGANPLATVVNLAAVDTVGAPGLAGTANTTSVTVSQFTLAASPKIKFMKGSAFRPWIIPFGLTFNVVSPPSNGVTVLNPGMQFGTGAEYAIWKAFKLGADVRYNLTGRSVDGVNTNGLTAGGYLGIGF